MMPIMRSNGKPLQDQYPGDDADFAELLLWAKKARNRIVRDIKEKDSLKYKNKKLKLQLKDQQIHSKKIRQEIKIYETMFSLGLWNCIKSCWEMKDKEGERF
ncbi:hypothetical protein EST62_12215 [Chlorobaculum sp. 24CR]|uniref:hypothetical protein n=1 Tax=Chlorobaculum sp. 24CR TaxID=2508878 RepID=UPI00100B2244|nr:hypothetical protein [Chlorobaculum sp. 24CR]RXK81087.1 hypothetical protein EST62_12215 [Chlorobaculum sp. 24CR]